MPSRLFGFVRPNKPKLLFTAYLIGFFFTGYYLAHARDGAEPAHQGPPFYPLYVLTLPVMFLSEIALEPLRIMNQRHGWPDALCALILCVYLYAFACAVLETREALRRRAGR